MKEKNQTRRELNRTVKRKRSKQAGLLRDVEKTRAKLEKRSRKLQAIEAEIAALERQSHDPDNHRLGQAADGDGSLRHALLIFNPKAKGAATGTNKLEEIVGHLRAHGILAEIGLKTSGKAARRLAQEAAARGQDLVIVAAGDGTIEEVASQLVGTRTKLGIVPSGTMNNLARALGVPLDLDGACALLGMGLTRQIDVGQVVSSGKAHQEYFLESAGIGLSALAFPAGQAAQKKRWGELPNMFRKLINFKPTHIGVQLDDSPPIQSDAQIVSVSNSPMLGMNTIIAPEAKMDDGWLDVAIYDGMSKTDLAAYYLSGSSGKHTDNPKVKFHRAKRILIQSKEPLEASSDMDVMEEGRHEWEINIVPKALNVIAGNGIGLSLPMEAGPAGPPLSGPQAPTVEQPPAPGNSAQDGQAKQGQATDGA